MKIKIIDRRSESGQPCPQVDNLKFARTGPSWLSALLFVRVAALVGFLPIVAAAQPTPLAPHQQLLREIFQELIEIDTTHSTGNTTVAADAMARRLLAAGLPAADVQVLAPAPRKGNLVARLRGSGARPPLGR